MKRLSVITLALAFMLILGMWGCNGSEGGGENAADDDQDGSGNNSHNYGKDIQGKYAVQVETTDDTCESANVGAKQDWIVDIKQTKDLSNAAVYYSMTGPGSQPTKLYEGKVYGTTIIMSEVSEEPIGTEPCTKVHVKTYYINVDLDTAILTGNLMDDIFYLGSCDASMTSCRTQRVISTQSSD